MKLRSKILISILMVSLTTLAISSYYLINRNHLDHINSEKERSLNDFTFIMNSLESGIDFQQSEAELQLLFRRYQEYYAARDILLMVSHDKSPFLSDLPEINHSYYEELLTVEGTSRLIQVIDVNDHHYFFVAGNFAKSEAYTLVYARDISNVYELRLQSIYLSLILTSTLVILLGFLSYLYSRWITKPLDVLNQGANDISQGNYSVRIPHKDDEFGDLGHAFNQMASAVEARTRELELRAKELQEFIDNLSHEMNTPLTSIQGYSDFLLHAKTTEDQKHKATEIIRQEAKRMKEIYTKLMLLTVTREQEPELQPVVIRKLFEELADSFLLQLDQQKIKLELHNELDKLLLDSTLIYMLLSNLIKNSILALPSGGTITLKAYEWQNQPVIEVSDNGFGIPKDKIPEIVKPFYRVDKSRSRKTGGAGLGLSICKNIAHLHKAELEIFSEEGAGTTIRVTFYNSVTTS